MTDTAMQLDPQLPPPDSARVSLLLALDWPEDMQQQSIFNLTVGGRVMTADERQLLGQVGPNDLVAMQQLTYESMRAQREKLDAAHRLTELVHQYTANDHEPIYHTREAMTADDRELFDQLADTAWPSGYLVFGQDTD